MLGLLADLKKNYNLEYILTYRLNQDVLENTFGVIRAKGGLHDHPDQLEFMYRLRSYILSGNDGIISSDGNVEVDATPDLGNPHTDVRVLGEHRKMVEQESEKSI